MALFVCFGILATVFFNTPVPFFSKKDAVSVLIIVCFYVVFFYAVTQGLDPEMKPAGRTSLAWAQGGVVLLFAMLAWFFGPSKMLFLMAPAFDALSYLRLRWRKGASSEERRQAEGILLPTKVIVVVGLFGLIASAIIEGIYHVPFEVLQQFVFGLVVLWYGISALQSLQRLRSPSA